ncbi:chromatin-remodeling complex ATPase [Acrasis kona]|uniref:Chromatin-remodeling complex ATPase n=1 Tax=Acrasis kona TaxID=1008807 RepID=A0AAW2Z8E3_9EUKA
MGRKRKQIQREDQSDEGHSDDENEQDDDGSKTNKDDMDYEDSGNDDDNKGKKNRGKNPNKNEKEHLDRITHMREEQRKLLRQLKDKQSETGVAEEDANEETKTMQTRFKYLLEQTEIFSHFMSGGPSGLRQPEKKKAPGGRTRKMTEKQEDAEILRETLEDEDKETAYNGHVSSRITSSPSFVKNTKLRDYQLEGLNWLIKQYDNAVNGILADEMGLGKTVQTIAFLGYLKFIRKVNGPHIVIVPKSVISNWINQTGTWCPDLTIFKFHGSKEEREEMKKEGLNEHFDILVTSYEIATKEKAALGKFNWKYIIIDEAHRIKNENSVLAQCVRTFNTQYRLLLTGTPLQNNLHELWALLNFLLPEVFDSAEDFDSWFNLKEGQAETEIIAQLHKVMKPFMLRRLKTDVECEIPPKKEIMVECGMSKMQKEWYRSILTKDMNALKGGEKMRLLNIVMQLRKGCNHPYLFDGAEPGPPYELGNHLIQNAGKMALLDRLLAKLQAQGSRVLIFSQMTRMLDILEDYCYLKQYSYCRIDGQTSGDAREAQMDEFNRPNSDKFIFLLSTRAGGLGINLATADTVVIYDSDWNPQADLQAQDRCHRIGQKKPVNVYRLITKDSIEEKIYQRAVKKLYLDAVVIQQGRLVEQEGKMSQSELLSMIRFGAEEIFNSTDSSISDEDLDAILTRGEAKVKEIDQQYKETCQNNLLNFSLHQDANLYEFEGLDYSQKPTTSIILDQEEETWTEESIKDLLDNDKNIEDIIVSDERKQFVCQGIRKIKLPDHVKRAKYCRRNDTFIQMLEEQANKELDKRRVDRRGNAIQDKQPSSNDSQSTLSTTNQNQQENKYSDFQFLNVDKLLELEANEANDEANQQQISQLLKEGFPDWTRKDLLCFIKGCEKYGRNDLQAISSEIETKSFQQVEQYSKTFWERYKEVSDWDKLIKRIEKGEAYLNKMSNNNYMLRYKTQKFKRPWSELKFSYGQNKGKQYTEQEDRFIVCMTTKLGYGNWEEVRNEIKNSFEFRFDWFFKSRTAMEIQRRCDSLIRLIEKEHESDLPNNEKKQKDKRPTKST